MKKMNYAEAIIDGYNAITGAIVAVLSYILENTGFCLWPSWGLILQTGSLVG